MKISEIFEGIQGEGVLVGVPTLFIRMSGCNLSCEYCDSKYHKLLWRELNLGELENTIRNSNMDYICWTGGEPTLQIAGISEVIKLLGTKYHTLETNGIQRKFDTSLFDYIVVSPKDVTTARFWREFSFWERQPHIVIKVVTDLKVVNMDLVEYADYLMPLSTFDEEKDKKIKQRVWSYCTNHNIKYSPRLQVDLWGNERCR